METVVCFVEIPRGSRNKYEFDHALGAIKLDRHLPSSTPYPCEYGFIADTLALDGDPLDVLICSSEPTFPGCLVPAKIIGLFRMRDEAGIDHKLVCVPLNDPGFSELEDIDDLPAHLKAEIAHFFKVYKDLDPARFSTVEGWADRAAALDEFAQARARFSSAAGTG